MPQRLRVDNGSPWGSPSDLPTDLALWLIGLGVQMHWNHPNRPQENGVVERSQGTGQCWAEPEACTSVRQLQQRLNKMDRIQRELYAEGGQPPRWQAYPGLAHSGRSYTRRWEQSHWDLQRVLEHLSEYVLTRRVGPAGHVSIYNRNYYVGALHQGKHAHIMLDAETMSWLVWDDAGRLLNRLAVKEMTAQNLQRLTMTKKSNRPKSQRQKRKNAAKRD
jgi:hypothetical protein